MYVKNRLQVARHPMPDPRQPSALGGRRGSTFEKGKVRWLIRFSHQAVHGPMERTPFSPAVPNCGAATKKTRDDIAKCTSFDVADDPIRDHSRQVPEELRPRDIEPGEEHRIANIVNNYSSFIARNRSGIVIDMAVRRDANDVTSGKQTSAEGVFFPLSTGTLITAQFEEQTATQCVGPSHVREDTEKVFLASGFGVERSRTT